MIDSKPADSRLGLLNRRRFPKYAGVAAGLFIVALDGIIAAVFWLLRMMTNTTGSLRHHFHDKARDTVTDKSGVCVIFDSHMVLHLASRVCSSTCPRLPRVTLPVLSGVACDYFASTVTDPGVSCTL